MIGYDDNDLDNEKKTKSVGSVIMWIVIMNLVFSFDSILSAMALTDVFAIMATAIIIGGILMIWLADRVSKFLEDNKLYEVLGLTYLVKFYGWQKLGELISINCFTSNPSISSSLKFLRKTPWARDKVEKLYLDSMPNFKNK